MKIKEKLKQISQNIKLFFKRLYLKIFKTDFLRPENLVNYIFTAESLPEPLDITSEQSLVKDFQENNDLSAKAKLIEHNLRLVVYIAKKFENTGIGIEDLISIGTIGLIKAINTFCADKNIKLATYASRCIENEILMFIRKTSYQRQEFSIDEPLSTDWDGNELLLSDVIGSDEDEVYRDIETGEEKRIIYAAIAKLGAREREIIMLRFGLFGGKEKTQKEVADMLGISQSYISRLEKKIISDLKKDIAASI